MKDSYVLILLFLSCIVATWLHHHKTLTKEYPEDTIIKSLSGAKKILPRNERIKIKLIDAGSDVYFLARYTLVPHTVSTKLTDADTSLIIISNASIDSVSHTALANCKILWQNKDNQYYYAITIPNTNNAKR